MSICLDILRRHELSTFLGEIRSEAVPEGPVKFGQLGAIFEGNAPVFRHSDHRRIGCSGSPKSIPFSSPKSRSAISARLPRAVPRRNARSGCGGPPLASSGRAQLRARAADPYGRAVVADSERGHLRANPKCACIDDMMLTALPASPPDFVVYFFLLSGTVAPPGGRPGSLKHLSAMIPYVQIQSRAARGGKEPGAPWGSHGSVVVLLSRAGIWEAPSAKPAAVDRPWRKKNAGTNPITCGKNNRLAVFDEAKLRHRPGWLPVLSSVAR